MYVIKLFVKRFIRKSAWNAAHTRHFNYRLPPPYKSSQCNLQECISNTYSPHTYEISIRRMGLETSTKVIVSSQTYDRAPSPFLPWYCLYRCVIVITRIYMPAAYCYEILIVNVKQGVINHMVCMHNLHPD